MKYDIPIRIRVFKPINGVSIQVQRGKNEYLPPSKVSNDAIVFDFAVSVDLSPNAPNFLGLYVQGPKDARFIYVNSGKQAGQEDSCWDRRAKLSLMGITPEQINAVIARDGSFLQAEFEGVGRDGGPTCASVKGVEWKVVSK